MRPPDLAIRQCHGVQEREDLQTKQIMCWVKWQANSCVWVGLFLLLAARLQTKNVSSKQFCVDKKCYQCQ